jgi:nucleoside-diphosphate-sugar epimerase
MKIVVMGGSGLIGQKLVTRLHERGHEAVAGFCQLVEAETLIECTDSLSWPFPVFKQPTPCP